MSEIIKEYDERGNLIYSKNSYGYEEWQEYDKNNNEIHYKDSEGFECWEEYDENNKTIYYKNNLSDSVQFWYKWIDNKKIQITQIEFEQIKRDKEYKEFISKEEVLIFELMDI